MVSYYIDDNYIDNDTKAPHIWVCNERLFGKHTIKVVVEDSTGKTSSDSIEVRIFNFGGFGNGLSGLAKNR